MFARIKSEAFLAVLSNMVSKPQLVNFTIKNSKTLLIEVYEPLLQSEAVEILDITKGDDNYTSLTVNLNLSYRIIDSEFVELKFYNEILEFSTPGYTASFKAEFEARIEIRDVESVTYKVDAYQLERISKNTVALRNMTKVLKKEQPALLVKSKVAYYVLSNMSCSIDFDFPDCIVSIDTLRAINQLAHVNGLSYVNINVSKDGTGYCTIVYGEEKKCAFTVKHETESTSENISKIIRNSTLRFTTIVAPIAEKVKVVEKSFKQLKLTVSLSETGTFVNCQSGVRSSLIFGYGTHKDSVMFETNITTLSTICKVMGDNRIDVKTNGRFICLVTPTQTLLLTGNLS